MLEFKVAALAEVKEIGDDEDIVAVPIEDVTYEVRRPTSAQVGLWTTGMHTTAEVAFEAIRTLLGADGLEHIKRLIRNRQIDMDDLIGGSENNPDGLIGSILAEFSGRPTEPSTASTRSQPSGGRRSTGRSPGKGSTRSSSPSTDS